MRRAALGLACLVVATWVAPALALDGPPAVVAVEFDSPTAFPLGLAEAALPALAARPLSRDAVREALDRLWSLHLFSQVWVEELAAPDGLRLRFHLLRRPWLRRMVWHGPAAVGRAELAAAAGLALDGDADEARLEQARQAMLAHFRRVGYFGAEVKLEAVADPATNAQDVTVYALDGTQARLAAPEIHGLAAFSPSAFRKALGLKAGARYTEEAAQKGVRAAEERLRGAGYFEASVRAGPPAWDAATNQVRLRLQVTEGPQYAVEFVGRLQVWRSTLRKQLPFEAAGIVDEIAVENAARLLVSFYRERGYAFAEVIGGLNREAAPHRIRFLVTPGPKVRVASLRFDGNRVFKADRLQSLLQTRRARLPGTGTFSRAVLERDLLVLLAFYRAQGMLDTTVGPPDVRFSDDRRRAFVAIPIEEGKIVRVASIRVEGQSVLSESDILRALPFQTHQPWSAARADEARRALAALYGRRGYPAADIAIEETRRDYDVDLAIRVREGEHVRVGRVLVSGLVRTHESVARREIPLKPGDAFDPEALGTADRRLSDLGIFDRVEVGPLQPPQAPFADVEVKTTEGKPWRLDLGAGYSTDEGFRGTFELADDNLFGTGRSAGVRQRVSRIEQRTDLTYREPWLFGSKQWVGTLNLYREWRSDIGVHLERYGSAAEVSRVLLPERTRGLTGGLRYRVDWVRTSNVDPSQVSQGHVFPGQELVAALRPSLTLDRRDNPLNPTRGSFHTVSLEGAGWPIGSEVNFLKLAGQTSWLFPWLPPTVLALGARLGLGWPLGDTAQLPIEERFFAGGESTIRGYRLWHVGPRDLEGNPIGGEGMILLNAEWRFPIWRFIGGALFADTGSVQSRVEDLRRGQFRTGVGAGLRLVTPVGPVRLDGAYALNPIGTDGRLQFYFSVGYPF